MPYRKGIAHIVLIVVAAIILLAITLLAAKFIFHKKIPGLSKEPNVTLKTEYNNPFDKKTQYVNPFDESKNPFVNLAKK